MNTVTCWRCAGKTIVECEVCEGTHEYVSCEEYCAGVCHCSGHDEICNNCNVDGEMVCPTCEGHGKLIDGGGGNYFVNEEEAAFYGA